MGSSRALVCLPVALVLVACWGKDRYSPGEKLGVFEVKAALAGSTCGQAPDPWGFDVRLNHDGSTLYWIQGGTPVQGIVDATTARTELRSESTTDLRAADARTKRAACTVQRVDRMLVTLATAEAKPASDPELTSSFTGALTYAWVPTEGSDCSDQLTASGGGFDALPCEVRYDVVGTFKSPPP